MLSDYVKFRRTRPCAGGVVIRWWHGGVPGLKVGDLIEPTTDTAHLLDDCPVCQARKRDEQLPQDPNDPTRVYVTTDREYARIYAAGYPRGALYRVEPVGELERTTDDVVESYACSAARVLAVYDACVILSPRRVRALLRDVRRDAW